MVERVRGSVDKASAENNVQLIKNIIWRVASRIPIDNIKIMDFCGTHEHTIVYSGLRSLMPENVELVAGPGCPVCVTPAYYVDTAITLALDGVRVYTYGDAYRLPGSPRLGSRKPRSLSEAKSAGGSVSVVYSLLQAIRDHKERGGESVFLGVGFETTAPSTASIVVNKRIPEGFTIISSYRLTPPIMRYTFHKHYDNPIMGVIAPGHVSAIVGARAWQFIPEEFRIPTIIAGFEPLDVLYSILGILKMIYTKRPRLINLYKRVVSWDGNKKAQDLLGETFEVVDAYWRGLGIVPESGYIFREKYRRFDALYQYGFKDSLDEGDKMPPGCRCAEVTLGLVKPTDCPLFMKTCRPGRPYGPCMVSSEGACSVWARFGGRLLEKLNSRR